MTLREQIADLQHQQWTGWMTYLLSRCQEVAGGMVMPREWVERWKRQMATPYAGLSEAERDSDREEADRVLVLLNAARAEAVLAFAAETDKADGVRNLIYRARDYVAAQGWLTQKPQEAPTTCTDCPRCGDHVRTSDLRQWLVCEQTHMEPAEYEYGCINCCPREEQ